MVSVDTDEANNKPKSFILDSQVQIIVVSSPFSKPKITPIAIFTKLATGLSSPQELLLTGLVLARLLSTLNCDVTSKLLRKLTLCFGYNPR